MDRAPTYQDLNRQKAEAEVLQSQTAQKDSVAQGVNTAAAATVNPVLAEYMSRNAAPQGLTPRDNGVTNDYSTIAGSVAKSVPDQEAYSMALITAAMKGQVPVEDVLADPKILDQAKVGLVNTIQQSQQNQGLGQIQQ